MGIRWNQPSYPILGNINFLQNQLPIPQNGTHFIKKHGRLGPSIKSRPSLFKSPVLRSDFMIRILELKGRFWIHCSLDFVGKTGGCENGNVQRSLALLDALPVQSVHLNDF